MPFVRPACERSVQGKPAVTTSTSGEPIEFPNVAGERNTGEAFGEDGLRRFPPLTQQLGRATRFVEPEFDSADAGEQPGNAE